MMESGDEDEKGEQRPRNCDKKENRGRDEGGRRDT
jgi:hypothetical protein